MIKNISFWKIKAFNKLGKVCDCCEEYRKEFLTVDHIHGGGKKHRNSIGNGMWYYKWICEQKNIHTMLRLLCMNCNWATRMKAICPHVKEGWEKSPKQTEAAIKRQMRELEKEQWRKTNARMQEPVPDGLIYYRHVAQLDGRELDNQHN